MYRLRRHAAIVRRTSRHARDAEQRESFQPRLIWWFVALVAAAGASALVATRFGILDGHLVYNFDSTVDFFLPAAFHDALAAGHLPLWSDKLALGFPLYAEGKIAAFYPPHWMIYQLPPLDAVQVTLLLHLAFLGVGMGLVSMRVGGSRWSSVLAAAAMPLAGGLVTKLEWTNMVEAFAWLPWILLPLLRHDRPTRADIALGGMAFGVQALLGHPNIWLLSGLTLVLVMLGREPGMTSLRRATAVVLIGTGVGAVQLLPTFVLIPLSVRANGLDMGEFFAYPGTVFDILGFGFSNPFTPLAATSNLNQTWYPSGGWGILEAGAYVGLPCLALAAVGFKNASVRPFLLPLAAFVIVPLIWSLRPDWLASVPLLNALRRPTRAYLFADFALVLAAVAGFTRLRQSPGPSRTPTILLGLVMAGYLGVALLATATPDHLNELLQSMWPYGSASSSGARAEAVLTAPVPVVLEILLGISTIGVLQAGLRARRAAVATAAMFVIPLAILAPPTNQRWDLSAFDRSGGPFMSALRTASPHRVLTLDRPTWYDGTPNQIALAGINDLEMHGSLELASSVTILAAAQADSTLSLARALGVDTVVAFGAPCPGTQIAQVSGSDRATICHLEGALRPPYWLPSKDISLHSESPGIPTLPRRASISASTALRDAVPLPAITAEGRLRIDAVAPGDGWVFIDRSWWPFWSVDVDGRPADSVEAWSGHLVRLVAGRHTITETLVPWDALLGAGIGFGAIVTILVWVKPSYRRVNWLPSSSPSCGRALGRLVA